MKKILFVAIFAILGLASMLTRTTNNTSTLSVGVSIPLTGDIAEFGTAVRNGIELAQLDSPTAFSNTRFVYEDNRYQASVALSAYANLRNVHGVDMIFDWGEPTLGAIAPLAERQKMPIIGMSVDPQPSVGKKYVIRSINHAAQFSKATISYTRQKGFKRIAVINTEDPFTNSMALGLKEQLRGDETYKVIFTAEPTEMDFKSAILRLKQFKPDVVAVYLLPGQVSAFYRQMGAVKYHVPTVGTDVFESETEIQQASGFMDGSVFPILHVPAEFSKKYQKQFGDRLHLAFAYNAYHVAKLIASSANTVTKNTSWTSGNLLAALEKNAQGAGPYSLDHSDTAGNYLNFPITMHKIENGQIKEIKN